MENMINENAYIFHPLIFQKFIYYPSPVIQLTLVKKTFCNLTMLRQRLDMDPFLFGTKPNWLKVIASSFNSFNQ
jgi:hypothetical protein